MLTGDNGILTKANDAKNSTEIGEEKEGIKLAVTDAQIIDQGYQKLTLENLKNAISRQFGDEAEVIENADGSFLVKVKDRTYSVSVNGNVMLKESNIKEYTDDGVPIPKDFYYVGGSKDKGVVISDVEGDNMNNDAKGNQFVWVPVNSENFETEFIRKDFGTQNIPDENFIDTEPKLQKYYEPTPANLTATSSDIKEEVLAMYESIKLNGGFYIARYETGNENNKPVSKKMYIPWQLPFESTEESEGAIEKARQMFPNHSHLCYGVEWDAIMRWINEDINLKKYLLNSSDIGNYGTEELIKTGSVNEYQIKNIFDMAGNASEWTMEMIGTSALVVRGGASKNSGAERPIAQRQSAQATWLVGFRIAFYI